MRAVKIHACASLLFQQASLKVDKNGFSYIKAQTERDAWLVQGFDHASHRWDFLKRKREQAQADSQLVNLSQRHLKELENEDQQLLEAYSVGVNAAQANANWQAADSLLLNLALGKSLDAEMLAAQAYEKQIPLSIFSGSGGASNAWAVGSAKSRSGKPLLANDPHLDCRELPGLLYGSSIFLPDITVSGFTMPGIPGVAYGRNDKLAVGLTSAHTRHAFIRPEGRINYAYEDHFPARLGCMRALFHAQSLVQLLDWYHHYSFASIVITAASQDGGLLQFLAGGWFTSAGLLIKEPVVLEKLAQGKIIHCNDFKKYPANLDPGDYGCPGTRRSRVNQLLREQKKVSSKNFALMQLDLKNPLARRLFKLLPGGSSLKKTMAGWDFMESKSSRQATALHSWFLQARKLFAAEESSVYAGLIMGHPYLWVKKLLNLAQESPALWRSYCERVERKTKKLKRPWGKMLRLRWTKGKNSWEEPGQGSDFTLARAAYRCEKRPFQVQSLAAMRMVIDLAENNYILAVLPSQQKLYKKGRLAKLSRKW